MMKAVVAALVVNAASARTSTDCSLAGYYSGIDMTKVPTTEAEWITLTDQLRARIVATAEFVPYSDSTKPDIWDAVEVLDAYQPGSTYVNMTYGNNTMPDSMADSGGTNSAGWNREHLWPKSFGLGESGPDYSNVFNLRPCDETVNSARGNKYFTTCYSTSSDPCKSPATSESAADTATNSKSWQPASYERGNIARSNFYMALRFNGSEPETTHLMLSECACATKGIFGNITSLLSWNMADSVDDAERARNDLACSDWQHDRNPFIDYPWLVGMFEYSHFVAPCSGC